MSENDTQLTRAAQAITEVLISTLSRLYPTYRIDDQRHLLILLKDVQSQHPAGTPARLASVISFAESTLPEEEPADAGSAYYLYENSVAALAYCGGAHDGTPREVYKWCVMQIEDFIDVAGTPATTAGQHEGVVEEICKSILDSAQVGNDLQQAIKSSTELLVSYVESVSH